METSYKDINLKEWSVINTWGNEGATYSEADATAQQERWAEWQADFAEAGQSGWRELVVEESDIPSHQHGMEVMMSNDNRYLYIRDVTQMLGGDATTLYRRKGMKYSDFAHFNVTAEDPTKEASEETLEGYALDVGLRQTTAQLREYTRLVYVLWNKNPLVFGSVDHNPLDPYAEYILL
jgi:hypothetical protein